MGPGKPFHLTIEVDQLGYKTIMKSSKNDNNSICVNNEYREDPAIIKSLILDMYTSTVDRILFYPEGI